MSWRKVLLWALDTHGLYEGDRVRAKQDFADNVHSVPKGAEGTVIEYDEGNLLVDFGLYGKWDILEWQVENILEKVIQ